MPSNQPAHDFIESLLTEPLLHGDEAHREWLRAELRSHAPRLEELFQAERQRREQAERERDEVTRRKRIGEEVTRNIARELKARITKESEACDFAYDRLELKEAENAKLRAEPDPGAIARARARDFTEQPAQAGGLDEDDLNEHAERRHGERRTQERRVKNEGRPWHKNRRAWDVEGYRVDRRRADRRGKK